jgi:PAS domain S-box-containing protein
MQSVRKRLILRYGIACLSVAAATAIRLALDPLLGDRFPYLAVFLALVVTALYGGVGPSLLALLLSWISVDQLLLQRHGRLPFFATKDQLLFAYLVVGSTVILLAELIRAAQRQARQSASDAEQALATLRASREWHRITLASIGDGVITTDASGCVNSLNAVAERLTGWSSAEAVGRPLADVFRIGGTDGTPAEFPVAALVRNAAVARDRDPTVLFARDLSSRWIDLNPTPIRDDRGQTTGVVIIFRDITDRRRVDEALRESELRFRQLADHITAVFWMFDPTRQKTLFISPAYEKIWGRSCQSLYEKPLTFLDALHPDDRAGAWQAHEALVSGRATSYEYRILHPDGTVRWVWDRGFPIRDDLGRVVRLAGIAEDITERKQAQDALRESEVRFRTVADAAPIMIWGSGPDMHCDYFNKQWLDFTGRTIEQELGDGWSQGVHPEDRSRCLSTYTRSFAARESFVMEYRLQRHDGEYRWVLDTGVPRFSADGTFSGYIGSCLDITERKRTEEELRGADRRKEVFLAVLSHELRNPLAPIQTSLDLLEQAGANGASLTGELATIRRQVENLQRLVDDLLDVSRISRGTIELRKASVDLSGVIAHAVAAIRPLVDDQRQTLKLSVPEEPLLLEADSTRLEQILVNLLINAARYTPHEGTIWFSADRNDHEVVIRVRDNGIGIDPDFLGKLFDLFAQDKRRTGRDHNGVGIGLSLVKDLVELHGGTIAASSHGPDMGSEFVVRLPLALDPHRRTEPPPPPLPVIPDVLNRQRILIVDDNIQAADGLGKLLSTVFGQDVRVVYNGKAALDLAGTFGPEIVLLDLEMSGMDGYDVAMRLRDTPECAHAQIVAVTGWGHEEDRRRCRAMGFDRHLVKPVTARDLRALLVDLQRKVEEHSAP